MVLAQFEGVGDSAGEFGDDVLGLFHDWRLLF